MCILAALHLSLHTLPKKLVAGIQNEKVYFSLSYDVASGSEITPCNKSCKPLVVYQFMGNVITSMTTLRT